MNQRILKIGALVLAILLILGVCLFANSLIGNPISKALAQSTAQKHLEQNYADRDFELERVSYSFKDGYYHAYVVSPSSQDSSFTLLINGFGKLRYDYYENNVTNGWNTANRIEGEYRKTVDAALESSSFPYRVSLGYGELVFVTAEDKKNMPDVPEYALITNELTPDAYYNLQEMGARAGRICLYIDDNTVSAERLAEILLGIRKYLDGVGIGFHAIDCVLEYPQNEDAEYRYGRVEVTDFLYAEIEEEGMLERVTRAIEQAEEYYSTQDKES